MKNICIFVSIILNFLIVNCQQSPCPHIFQYQFDGISWYGTIELPSPSLHRRESRLKLKLLINGELTKNNVGTISLVDSFDKACENMKKGLPTKYRVQFPYGAALPKIVEITYNGVLSCSGLGYTLEETGPGSTTLVTLTHTFNPSLSNQYVTPPPASTLVQAPTPGFIDNRLMTTSSRPIQTIRPQTTIDSRIQNINENSNDICGTTGTQNEFKSISGVGSRATRQGDWPWIAAIYLTTGNGLSFSCGGSLVNTRAVITAAHCMRTRSGYRLPHEVVVWLGRYSLLDWDEIGANSSNVVRVVIHPDYKKYSYESYDADIAILILERQISYTQYIRPICLWPSTSGFQDIEGQKGVTIGWGKDGTGNVISSTPNKVNIPVVDPITCIQNNESLLRAVSNRTFCAGSLNGQGPCHGDSGGGLMIYRNNRWMLRGIISAGVSDPETGYCKLTDYVIFTDVSSFLSWIQANL